VPKGDGETELLRRIERFRCRSAGDPEVSVDMSCNKRQLRQDYNPDNEITIAVDPEDPDHLLAGSNDYYYFPFRRRVREPGVFVPTGFFTSFDGGEHWIDGQIPFGEGNNGGDPAPAFDAKHDVALMASLDFRIDARRELPAENGNIAVSRSVDGGRTFEEPVIAMRGRGSDVSPTQVFFDKEFLTVDNNPDSPFYGRAYVTATRFFGGFEDPGFLKEFPIFLSYSDDGGKTWSTPREISGSHPTCTFQTRGPANECDEDQFSIPEVASDGTVYVHLANFQNEAEWEVPFDFDGQIMVVRSTDGGRTFSDPVPATQVEDGFSDMPFSVLGDQTIWGHQFRWNAYGTITAHPKDAKELTIIWSDRGRPNPRATEDCLSEALEPPRYDPCRAGPGLDTDVFMVSSGDGGKTWSERAVLDGAPAPQWYPWADYTPEGKLAVAWDEDTRPSPADHFNHVLWVENEGQAVLRPNTDEGRTATENPDVSVTHWVGDVVPRDEWPTICGPRGYSDPPIEDAEGKDCNYFLGDYTGLAVGSDGSINVVWTGLNRFATSNEIDQYTGGLHDGYAQDAMFARRER
jgi:hypothetical protein